MALRDCVMRMEISEGIMKNKYSMLIVCCVAMIASGCSNTNITAQSISKPGSQVCLKEYTALKTLDKTSYNVYAKQFAELNKSYATYKAQGDSLNKDAKEVLGLELDSKLQMVCARVKNAAFNSMQNRSLELNKL